MPPADPPAPSNEWLGLIPEDKRGANVFNGIKAVTPGDALVEMGTQLENAQSRLGDAGVKIPGQDATDEEVDAFRKHYNLPDKPEGYQLPTEGLYNGPQLSEAGQGYLKQVIESSQSRAQQIGHKLKLTPHQTAMLYREYIGIAGEDLAAHESTSGQAREAQDKELRTKWGPAYDQQVRIGDAAQVQFGGQELVQLAAAAGITNNPAWRLAWANIGKTIGNDEIHGSGSNSQLMDTSDEASIKIKELKKDPDYAKKNVRGKEIRKQVDALYLVAFPEPASE